MIYKKIVGKIVGIFFVVIGYLIFTEPLTAEENIFNIILQIWLSYFLTFVGVGILLNEIVARNKIASFIYTKILALPAIGFIYAHYISAPILTIVIFLGIYLIPSIWLSLPVIKYPITPF